MKPLLYLLVLFSISCAQQTALTGGDKDISAPGLIFDKTQPKPNSTNFEGKEIKLVFNENIIYQKTALSFISNPPIGKHEIIVDKNILHVNPESRLKENTTYTLMFANSIADLNEKNKIQDFRTSFSTGNVVDSISVNGSVKNSTDQSPNVDFLVSLESTNGDSLQYLSISKENGDYSFTNLKPGKYFLSAWNDLNKDKKLDTLSEPYGFLSDFVIVEDSCCKEIINTFTPIKSLSIDDSKIDEYGQLSVIFNQPIDTFLIKNIDSSAFNKIIVNNETANFWLSDSVTNNYQFIVAVPTWNYKDTLTIRKTASVSEKSKLIYQKKSTKSLLSSKSLHLEFNQELMSIDTSLVVLKIDSMPTNYSYVVKNNKLIITPESFSNSFDITAFPEGFIGFFNSKSDTSKIYFSIPPPSSLGSLSFDVNNSLNDNFIIQILSNSEVIHELFSSERVFNKKIERVIPGEYELRLIIDNDANKKWTPGNIKINTQPEKVIYLDRKILIQKNWEEYIKWDL